MSLATAYRRASRRLLESSRFAAAVQRPMLVRLGLRFTSNVSDGAVSTDKGWSQREKAAEGRFAHDRELEQLRRMRAKLETQERDLETDIEHVEQQIAVHERDLEVESKNKKH